jgi:amino acid transporter
VPQLKKSRDKRKALIYKTLSLFIFLITINAIWISFFYSDDTLDIVYGILTPILYCVFYYSIKKTRKKFKSKIKSYIYIPIAYAFFGVIWYLFAGFFIYVSDKLDGSADEIYEANTEQSNKLSNIQEDSKNLFDKLNVKTFFLFNPNLAYPCKVAEELETMFTHKKYVASVHHSKQQTHMIILFVLLFLIQIAAIYISENLIYNRIKPQTPTIRRRRSTNFLKLDDAFINEDRVNETVELTKKTDNNSFPKL